MDYDMEYSSISESSFRDTYVLYHDCEVRIRKKNDRYTISGYVQSLDMVDWFCISMFWSYRLQNKHTHKHSLLSDDFTYIEDMYDASVFTTEHISVILNIPEDVLIEKWNCTLEEAYNNIINNIQDEITYNDVTKTCIQWAYHLGIDLIAFKTRLYTHGMHEIAFISEKEYYNIPFHKRNKIRLIQRFKKEDITAPDPDLNIGCTYKEAKTILISLIKDAQHNLQNSNEYTDDCLRWLNNNCKGLESMLECVEEFSTENIEFVLQENRRLVKQYRSKQKGKQKWTKYN